MKASVTRKLVAGATALFVTLQYAGPAIAAVACFQSADMEADQAIRYENELMVLSDTCGDDTYRDFTLRNRVAIIGYQKQMMNYFRRTGARRPQAALDSFLTQIANEEALRAARQPAQTVCNRAVTFLTEAKALGEREFRSRVAALATENEAHYRKCRR